MNRIRITLACILVLAVAVTGCFFYPDEEALVRPAASSGSADFTRYVALGNSLTVGYQSAALYESAQLYSTPAMLAQVMGTDFEQPLVADPGTSSAGFGHLEVVFVEGEADLEYVAWPGGTQPAPLNGTLLTPYNNLGIPGALLWDLLNATTSTNCASYVLAAPGEEVANPHFDLVLRNGLGLWEGPDDFTALEQAIMLDPTFLTVWIGNNEILGPATQGEGATLVTVGDFELMYTMMLNGLIDELPEAEIVVANIPPITAAPFFTTVPFVMVDSNSDPIDNPLTVEADMMGWLAEEGEIALDWTPMEIPVVTMHLAPGDLVLLPARTYLAQGMGYPDWILIAGIMEATGMSQGDAEAALPALYPQHGTPLPANLTLTGGEVAILGAAVVDFNAVIADLAAARDIPVVDIYALMSDIVSNGATWNGTEYSMEFVTGGVFSLDGVHPANVGNAIVASEFIDVINEAFGAALDLPDLPEILSREETGRSIRQLPSGFVNLP